MSVSKTKKASRTAGPKTLVLIDAHAIIHRAFHAIPPLVSPHGEPTGALYGLASFLIKTIRELKPDYIAACFDRPEPTFRQVMSPKGFRLWKKNGSAVPWNDEKFKTNYAFWEDYQRYDILCSARKIKAPLLVLQGSTDAIVAPAGARDLTHAASATLAFIDAGHDYAEPGAIQRVNELTMNWFKRHLR